MLYQDVFNGGVTAGGFSTGMGSGSGTVELYVEPGSTIREAYLFVFSSLNATENLYVNNTLFHFSAENRISTFVCFNSFFSPLHLHAANITAWLQNNFTSTFNMEISEQSTFFEGVYAPFIWIAYENPALPQISTTIIVNDQDLLGYEVYNISNLNSINNTYPVGFSLYSDRSETDIPLNKQVYFNSFHLGNVGGTDNVNSLWDYAGVKGHFYYQNYTLFGLDDDTPDSLMTGTDGLADVSSYIDNNATSVNFQLLHSNYPNQSPPLTHINLAYFLAYTSPCEAFEASVTENIQACKDQPAQLQATGGVSTSSTTGYQWQPQVDLSCYDCPNPVFLGDTSRFYTCRIWNTDSCSKVLPVKVNVLQDPAVPAYTTTPTECYAHTGEITIHNSPTGFTYSLNGSVPQTQTLFNDLAEGYHLLTVTDGNGCKSDTSVYVGEVNTTVAQFSVSPQNGNVPLEVTLTNQSQNATSYTWYLGNDTLHTISAEPFTHTFTSEGNFDIALVAYHTTTECGDTAYKSIATEYPFSVIVPTLYGGYIDGSPYQIYTSGLRSLQFKLYAYDGRLVYVSNLPPEPGYHSLWESTDIAAGLYVYRIRAIADDGTEKIITGKLVVV